jgi:23S rRNA (adenine2030-N6)-methyltransferase
VIWYPIKLAAEADSLRLALAATARERPVLYSELYAYAPDSRIGLNGSGLAIVNPPWQIGERMRAWLPPLAQRLAADVPAGRRAGEGAARCRILHSPEPGDPDSRR